MFARYKAYRRRAKALRQLRRHRASFEGRKRTITVVIPIWIWLPVLGYIIYVIVR